MRIRYARGSFLRSPLIIGVALAVVIAAQGVLEAALNSEEWVGNWRTTSSVLHYATLWGGCFTAVAAAWVVASPRRHRYSAMLNAASRPAWQIYLRALLAVIGGSVAGYVLVAGYAAMATRGSATHGGLDVLEMVPALGWTMAGVGFGAIAGRLVAAFVAPAAAAIVPYLLTAAGMSVDFASGRTFFGDLFGLDDSARDYLRVPAELLACKSLLWILLGAAALAWILRSGRTAYALVLVAGFAAAGSFLVAGVRYDVASEHAAACLGGGPRVCTDRAHDHLLPEYQELVRGQLQHLDGISLDGYTVVQSPDLIADARQVTVEIAQGYTSPAHEIDRRVFAARFGTGLFLTRCLDTPAGARSIMLYRWWLLHNELPTDGSNYIGEMNVDYALSEDPTLAQRAQQFAAMSDADRGAWLRRNERNILTCAPGADS